MAAGETVMVSGETGMVSSEIWGAKMDYGQRQNFISTYAAVDPVTTRRTGMNKREDRCD